MLTFVYGKLQCLHGLIQYWMALCLATVLHQVQAAIGSSGGSKAAVSEGVEASVIYVRFKAAASEVIVAFLAWNDGYCIIFIMLKV